MKLFVYGIREYDELPYFEQLTRGYGLTFSYTAEYPSMENVHLAAGYPAISIITNRMDAPLMDAFYKAGVRHIATRSIGTDHIDLEHARKIGMHISHVNYPPETVADYAIMLILMSLRKMTYILDRAKLQDFSLQGKLGRDLCDCTVGVVGTGQIGRAVICHLAGFGCRLYACDPVPDEELSEIVTYTDFETLLRKCDVITLHAPAAEDNFHLFDKEAFSQIRPGAVIVNTARGTLIDTDALIEALEEGRVAAAALDVLEDENDLYFLNRMGDCLANPQMAMLRSFPNVILSPHTAFYTEKVVWGMAEHTVRCICDCVYGVDNPLVLF